MKRIYAGCLLLACLALALGWRLLDGSSLASRITAASAHYGEPLKFERQPSFSLFPPVLSFGPVSWQGNIGGIAAKFSAAGGNVHIRPIAFFLGNPELSELNLLKPHLLLTPAAQSENRTVSEAGLPEIDHFVAQDGIIEIRNATGILRLDDLRLTARDLRPRQEAELQGDCTLNWQPVSGAMRKGNLAFRAMTRYYNPNLTFRDSSATFTSTQESAQYPPLQARFDGAFDLDNLKTRLQKFAVTARDLELTGTGEYQNGEFDGAIRLSGNSAAFLPVTAPFAIASDLQVTGSEASLSSLSFTFADCEGSGTAKIDFNPLKISGSLKTGPFLLSSLEYDPDDKKIFPLLEWPEIDTSFSIASIGVTGPLLDSLSFQLAGSQGKYQIRNFTAKCAGGNITGSLTAGLPAKGIALDCHGEGIGLGKILAQTGLPGLSGGLTSFTLELEAEGPDLLHTASGLGRLESDTLRLDPLGELALLLPLLGKKGSKLPEVLDSIRIGIQTRNGNMTFSPIQATGPGFHGSGWASLDLADGLLKGRLDLTAMGLNLPVSFEGPLASLKWQIAP